MKRTINRVIGGLLGFVMILSSLVLPAPVIIAGAAAAGGGAAAGVRSSVPVEGSSAAATAIVDGFSASIIEGKIVASFSNASGSPVGGFLIVASYSGGFLIHSETRDFSAPSGSAVFEEFEVVLNGTYSHKVFCWDTDYIPLYREIIFEPFDSTDIVTRSGDHPNIEGINIGRGTVKVTLGTTAGQLLSQIVTANGAGQSYAVTRNGDAIGGTLFYGDILTVTSLAGQIQKQYKVITMGDTDNTEIEAKVLDSYDFGMQGSNIGKIEDTKITLIDGKVRRLFVNDAFDGGSSLVKTRAVEINKETYTGALGRLNSLRSSSSIIAQIQSTNRTGQSYSIVSAEGVAKTTANPVSGDKLVVTSASGAKTQEYVIEIATAAMSGKLLFPNDSITYGVTQDIVLEYYAGQRSPEAEVNFYIPAGIGATMENTTVNLVGRGEVKLNRFHESRGALKDGVFDNPDAHKLLGRFAVDYPYQTLGTVDIVNNPDGSQVIRFKGLDLRPNNGADFILTIEDVNIPKTGELNFAADMKTKNAAITPVTPALQSFACGSEQAVLNVVDTVADFRRLLDDSLDYSDITEAVRYGRVNFAWTAAVGASGVEIWQTDGSVSTGGIVTPGTVWTKSNVTIAPDASYATVSGLASNRFYQFKLVVNGGKNRGEAGSIVGFYSGKLDAALFGMTSTTNNDATARTNAAALNTAIAWLNSIGGGTVWARSSGNFYTATIHLKSNVYLYVESGCNLYARTALMDDPEDAWWHYGDYASGTSDNNDPYNNPDNFLSKQDVGHCYFQNTMIYGRRVNNIKIIGNGRIHGNSALSSSDAVMNNGGTGARADDMIALKLCTNIEFGGLSNGKDLLWNGSAVHYTGMPATTDGRANMLQLNAGGHFVLLASGCDSINTHDLYYNAGGNYRDMLDYMECNDVYVTNIFTVYIGDDIVKPGSDCSLGFTRPISGIYVRNIIGSTGCNNFQIGSETADDIQDVYVDNLITLQSNKCAFSISTNDGAYMKNINLNTGHTGPVLGLSRFERSRTPIFISISHRGRVIGAKRNTVSVSGTTRGIIQNVPIGIVDGVTLKDVEIVNAESGGEYTSVFVGYQMPPGTPSMCDGRFTGYIKNVTIDNVKATLKGGHAFSEVTRVPPELNIGSYNSVDMGARPSYGYYIRHVENFTIKDSSVDFEANDNRYPICLDDVKGATFDNFVMAKGTGVDSLFQLRNDTTGVNIRNNKYTVQGEGTYDVKDITGLSGTDNMTYPFIIRIALEKAVGAAKVYSINEATQVIEVPVSTTVAEMLSDIVVSTKIDVEFTVTNASGTPKATTATVSEGDVLKCVAMDDRDVTRNYTITVAKPSIMLAKKAGDAVITLIDNTTATIEVLSGALAYQLLGGLISANDLSPVFSISSSDGTPRGESDTLLHGDKLTASVISSDPEIGVYSKVYTVNLRTTSNVINRNYYNLRSTEVTYSASNMNATSSDSGVSYLQTPSVSAGAWVNMPFTVTIGGIYKVELIWKINTSGRATIQNSIDGTNVGPALTQMSAAQGRDVSTSIGSTNTAKYYLTELTGDIRLGTGVHDLRTTATSTGAIVLHSAIITLVAEENPIVFTKDILSVQNYAITAATGTPVTGLNLPVSVQVVLDDGEISLPVVWDTSAYNGNLAGTYILTGTPILPANGNITNTTSKTSTLSVLVAQATSAGVISMIDADEMTVGTVRNIAIEYNVTSKVNPISGSHPVYPKWEVVFTLPAEFPATVNDEVSIVGQQKRKLEASEISADGRTVTLQGLELQPKNGGDVRLYLYARRIPSVGTFEFKAINAIAGRSHSAGAVSEKTVLRGVAAVSDFKRVIPIERYKQPDYSKVQLSWIAPANPSSVFVECSTDGGDTWNAMQLTTVTKVITNDDVQKVENVNGAQTTRKPPVDIVPLDDIVVGLHEFPKYAIGVTVTTATLENLPLNTNFVFRLNVTGGENAGISNMAKYYSGHFNIVDFGAVSSMTTDGAVNCTAAIQAAYDAAAATGGGTVYVPPGIYGQGTVHLRNNVYLYLEKGSMIWGLPYCVDRGERLNEYQDGGHSYHPNAMFHGTRLDNIKIVGLGMIDGGTATQTGDTSVGSGKADKQLSIMLCTNYEFGGYGAPDGNYTLSDKANKLVVDRVGHFQLLSDACEYMDIHDMYIQDTTTNYRVGEFGIRQYHTNNAYRNRDILDLMGDSFVNIENIYCEFAADDIVKLGCDYSTGFAVKSGNYRVNNIEAWTWCNGFQCGSETVGDLSNVHVSNMTIWQADKAAFSLCINDGMTIRNVLLDGENFFTQCRVPVHLVTSNRGRRPGGPELCQVGSIHDVTIKNVKIQDNTGIRSTGTYPITSSGLNNYRDGVTTYNSNINFENIEFVTRRASPTATISSAPVEMPESSYQVDAMGARPAYGFYLRHIKGVSIKNCRITYQDGHDAGLYAVVIDDVSDTVIDNLTAKLSSTNTYIMKAIKSSNVTFKNSVVPFSDGFDAVATENLYPKDLSNTGIRAVAGAQNIISVLANTITVREGTTVGNLLAQIIPANSSVQTYKVFVNAQDVTANATLVFDGAVSPVLSVTSQDGVNTAEYAINVYIVDRSVTSIKAKAGSSSIKSISESGIVVYEGALVSDVIAQIEPQNDSVQTYQVLSAVDAPKAAVDPVVSGDKLKVVAENGVNSAIYALTVEKLPVEPITIFADSLVYTTSAASTSTSNSGVPRGRTYVQILSGGSVPVGTWLEFDLPAIPAGKYALAITAKERSGRATVQLSVDGVSCGSPLDLTNGGKTTDTFPKFPAGEVNFTSTSSHKLRMTVTVAGGVNCYEILLEPAQ